MKLATKKGPKGLDICLGTFCLDPTLFHISSYKPQRCQKVNGDHEAQQQHCNGQQRGRNPAWQEFLSQNLCEVV